jgi:Flp pilus assembly protein TadG
LPPSAEAPGRARARRGPVGPGAAGQALVETALAFPLLLVAAIGLLQVALYVHALNVVTGAVQEGARVAAAEDRTLGDGVAHAQALLRDGLGRGAGDVALKGTDGGDAVALEASGQLRAVIPWTADAGLPLRARAVVSKERFRAGAGG